MQAGRCNLDRAPAFNPADRGVEVADEQGPGEEDLESRQAAALYPLGRALRRTYDAENHDSLGTDLTGLMLELARIDPDAAPRPRGGAGTPAAPAPAAADAPRAATEKPSWWRAAMERLLAR